MTELRHSRRIYLVRHGETSDNRQGIASGRHNNTHLTGHGIEKAIDLNTLLAKLDPPVTHATSSSLERAQITEYLATGDMPVTQLPPHSDFDERDYEENGQMKAEGEPFEAHQERVIRGINRLLEDAACTPLVVCHGGTIRRVMDAIGNFQKAPDYLKVPNASVIEVVTPSGDNMQDWQLNVITLGDDQNLVRRPIAPNAEIYRRRNDETRTYHA